MPSQKEIRELVVCLKTLIRIGSNKEAILSLLEELDLATGSSEQQRQQQTEPGSTRGTCMNCGKVFYGECHPCRRSWRGYGSPEVLGGDAT